MLKGCSEMTQMKETVLTVKEAAEYLRIHPITLYRLLEKNKVSGVFKIGNQWRFKKEVMETWKISTRQRKYENIQRKRKKVEKLMQEVVRCLEKFYGLCDETTRFSIEDRYSSDFSIIDSREEIGTVLEEVRNFVKEIKGEIK